MLDGFDFGSRRRVGAWFTAAFVGLTLVGAGSFAVAENDPAVECPAPDSQLAPEAWPEQCPRPDAASGPAAEAAAGSSPADAPQPGAEPAAAPATSDGAAEPAGDPPAAEAAAASPAGAPGASAAAAVPSVPETPDPSVPTPPVDGADPTPTPDPAPTPDPVPTTDPTPTTDPVATPTPGPDTDPAPTPDPQEGGEAPAEPVVPQPVEGPAPTLPPASVTAPDDGPVDVPVASPDQLQELADEVLAATPPRFGDAITAQPGRRARRATVRPAPKHEAHEDTHEDTSAGPGLTFPSVDVDWSSLTPLAPPDFDADEAARFPGPSFLLPIYEAAAAQYNVPWQVLASINEIETNYGRNQGPSSAGAVGWMQFMPATWQMYGVDANGDGVRNPADPVDAIFAAGRYLHAAGGLEELDRAVFAYNHAGWYVERVLRRAVEFGRISPDLLAALSAQGRKEADAIRRVTGARGYLDPKAQPRTIGRTMLLSDAALRRRVLQDRRITIYPCGRGDVADGVVDRRVLEVLEFLAFRKLHPTVTSLRCGHGYLTASGNVSDHSHGGAVDIAAINGVSIAGHQGADSITADTIQQLLKLQGGVRPGQIISLMEYANAPNTLALGDHDDHIHVGFPALRGVQAEDAR